MSSKVFQLSIKTDYGLGSASPLPMAEAAFVSWSSMTEVGSWLLITRSFMDPGSRNGEEASLKLCEELLTYSSPRNMNKL